MSGEELVVLLNDNARKVGRRVKRSLSELIPWVKVYSSRSLDDASRYIREIVDNRYSRVFSGGGDGSMITMINLIRRYVDEKNQQIERLSRHLRARIPRYQFPDIGILKLGTGNGWARIVGSKRGIKPLLSVKEKEAWRIKQFNLLESENRLIHFAGLGWDAAILNDYINFKKLFGIGPLKRIMNGLLGYLSSLALKTLPRELFKRKRIEARIINQGEEVYGVDMEKGDNLKRLDIGRGDVLYEGYLNVVGAGVITDYGFGLKAFPFAGLRPDMMNLRVVKSGVFELLSHARSVWMGRYRSENILDFMANKVTIDLSTSLPFQMAGDAMGYRDKVTFEVSDYKVRVIDFSSQ